MTSSTTTTVPVTVNSTLASISVSGPSSVNVGNTGSLGVVGKDGVPQNLTLSGDAVTWTSSDTTVATVEPYGLTPKITPLKAGTATFTATYSDPSLLGAAPTASASVTITSNGSILVGIG